MTSFYTILFPPAAEGDWSYGIEFTWEEASRIVNSSNGTSHFISWDGSRIDIDLKGDATWIVKREDGTEKRWDVDRKKMNRALKGGMDENPVTTALI